MNNMATVLTQWSNEPSIAASTCIYLISTVVIEQNGIGCIVILPPTYNSLEVVGIASHCSFAVPLPSRNNH